MVNIHKYLLHKHLAPNRWDFREGAKPAGHWDFGAGSAREGTWLRERGGVIRRSPPWLRVRGARISSYGVRPRGRLANARDTAAPGGP